MVEGRQDQTGKILNFSNRDGAFIDRIANSEDRLKAGRRECEQRPPKPYLFSPNEIGQSSGIFAWNRLGKR